VLGHKAPLRLHDEAEIDHRDRLPSLGRCGSSDERAARIAFAGVKNLSGIGFKSDSKSPPGAGGISGGGCARAPVMGLRLW
jgi:hypothetical protein